MDEDRGLISTRCLSLRLRTFFVGAVQFMLAAILLAFHILNLLKIIETKQLLGTLFSFAPEDEKKSHHAYHVVSTILASIMLGFTFVLFWGIFNYKENLIWAWILSNSMFCLIYGFLIIYGIILRYMWFVVENIIVIACIIVFIAAVCPYYNWLYQRNLRSRRLNNAKPNTSKRGPA